MDHKIETKVFTLRAPFHSPNEEGSTLGETGPYRFSELGTDTGYIASLPLVGNSCDNRFLSALAITRLQYSDQLSNPNVFITMQAAIMII